MTYSGPWRVVHSLEVLRAQLDAAFPGRSHASDGTIADDQHSTSSDHYPHRYPVLGTVPVVTAFDGTQDPTHGCDNTIITEAIRVSRDARVKYVIWDHRMFSSYASSGFPAWAWRPYTGSDDPHTNHFHISVQPTALADSTAPWAIGVDMALTAEERAILDTINRRVGEMELGTWSNDNAQIRWIRVAVEGRESPVPGAPDVDGIPEIMAAIQAIHPSLSPQDVAAIAQAVAPIVTTAVLDSLAPKIGDVLEKALAELLPRVRQSIAPPA